MRSVKEKHIRAQGQAHSGSKLLGVIWEYTLYGHRYLTWHHEHTHNHTLICTDGQSRVANAPRRFFKYTVYVRIKYSANQYKMKESLFSFTPCRNCCNVQLTVHTSSFCQGCSSLVFLFFEVSVGFLHNMSTLCLCHC